MRLHVLKLFLLLIFIQTFNPALGQTCKGSLGDPVVRVDFGAGAGNGGPLPDGLTSLNYTSDCPRDGSYSITHYSGGCHTTWHTVYTDHTGNTNGFFMMINANNDPNVFFTQTTDIDALCSNTTYEFSAYVLNLMKLSSSDNTVHHPDIEFSVETVDGVPIGPPHRTFTIEPTDTPEWVRESFMFTTPANTTRVVIKMTNKAPGGNGNDLLLDDISFRACGPLVQTGFTTVSAHQNQNVCLGQTQTYTLVSTIGEGYDNPKRQWQQNNGDGNGWVDISGQTADTYRFTLLNASLATYQYRLAVAEGDNITSVHCRVYSDPLSVTVNPYPVVPDILPQQSCAGDVATFTASGGVSYEWSGPGITSVNKNQNPLIFNPVTPGDAGNYTVKVTSAAGCSSTTTTALTVHLNPVLTVDNPSPTICSGNSVVLNASAPGATQYLWTPATGLSNASLPNPVANPAVTTVYTVRATNTFDCFDEKTVTVNVLPPPVANAGSDKKIFEGQSVKLDGTAQNGDTYSWTPTDYLSDPHVLNPIASPVNDITYTLQVTSSYNCGTNASSVFVRVYKKIIIPNTFSPNGDGKNDLWDIEALVTYPQSLLRVYNRYGQQVFKSLGYDHPWAGTYNNAILPPGTYYYMIDLKNGAPLLSGWVQLIR